MPKKSTLPPIHRKPPRRFERGIRSSGSDRVAPAPSPPGWGLPSTTEKSADVPACYNSGEVIGTSSQRIESDPAVVMEKPMVADTRIAVEWILEKLAGRRDRPRMPGHQGLGPTA